MESFRKSALAVLGISILVVSIISFSPQASGESWENTWPLPDGDDDGYLDVGNADDLQSVKNDLDNRYELTRDVDASETINWDNGSGFEPIGTFSGVFNGQGHVIENLYIDRTSTDKVGLFGYLGSGGVVHDLGLVGGSVRGKNQVGSLVGKNLGKVENCFSSLREVNGSGQVGGLVGESVDSPDGGVILNSYSSAFTVSASDEVGGLVGRLNAGTVSNCYSIVENLIGSNNFGAMIGSNVFGGSVSDSFWDNEVCNLDTSNGGKARTTDEMMDIKTFTDSGWDFCGESANGNENLWNIEQGVSYPHLTWENGWSCNEAPSSLTNPSPLDGATDVDTPTEISVDVEDPDGDSMSVAFYENSTNQEIGTDPDVPDGGTAKVEWTGLDNGTIYYWYAVADDGEDMTTSSVFSFKTKTEEEMNEPPDQPTNPSPEDGSVDVSTSRYFSVDVSDPDEDYMDVTFYDNSNDEVLRTDSHVPDGRVAEFAWLGLESGENYSWYVVAEDDYENTRSSAWSFTTETETGTNSPPDPPNNPTPANNSRGVSTSPKLSVDVSDSDDEFLNVTFYDDNGDKIGTDSGVSSNWTATVSWSGLENDEVYSWHAVADDGELSTTSSTWSFTTRKGFLENTTPGISGGPNPPDGAVGVSVNPDLSVEVFDEDGDNMTVTFHEKSSGDKLGSTRNSVDNGDTVEVTWEDLSPGEKYSWYVTVDDGSTVFRSENFSFTTIGEKLKPGMTVVVKESDVEGMWSIGYELNLVYKPAGQVLASTEAGSSPVSYSGEGSMKSRAGGLVIVLFSLAGLGFSKPWGEEGLSPVLGSILLIALIVVAVGILVLFLGGVDMGESSASVSIAMRADGDKVLISNEGGGAVSFSDLTLRGSVQASDLQESVMLYGRGI